MDQQRGFGDSGNSPPDHTVTTLPKVRVGTKRLAWAIDELLDAIDVGTISELQALRISMSRVVANAMAADFEHWDSLRKEVLHVVGELRRQVEGLFDDRRRASVLDELEREAADESTILPIREE